MQCVLLAAGYATRLYPLTENMPKALLKLGDKTILEMVTDKIDEVSDVENIYIVTNEKFYKQFEKWCESYKGPKKVKVINDHTTSNDNRLGAIGDLKYVIDTENINDEILVMASDNIFDFSLCDFVDMYRSKNADMICAHTIENKEDLHSMGVVELDGDGKVTSFEEKPKHRRPERPVGNHHNAKCRWCGFRYSLCKQRWIFLVCYRKLPEQRSCRRFLKEHFWFQYRFL